MISQYSADSDIADWLSIIHLERYQDIFKKHGYYVARDAVFLDNENLQLIGITATGHRKRILNLVQQTQVLVEGKVGPMAEDAHAKPDTYTEPLDTPRVCQIGEAKNGPSIAKRASGAAVDRVGNKQHSAGISQDPTMEKEPVPPLTKPVPKPRTIFYCPSPGAKSEQDPVPKPLARSIVPTHKPGFDGNPGSFVRLEGFMPGETSTDLKNSELTPEQPGHTGEKSSKDVVAPSIGVRKSALEPTPENQTGLSEMGLANEGEPENPSPPIPSVPPRLGHKAQLIESSPATLTESCPAGSPSLTAAATLATSTQGDPLLCLSASSQPARVHSRLEMVSNVLYEGLNPWLEPAGCSGGEEVMENQTATQLPGPATEEVSPSSEKPESPRWPYLSLPPIPQRPISRPDLTEEPISPYCESVFVRSFPAQEQKGTGLSNEQGYKVVPQKFPDLKQEGPRRNSEYSSEGRSEDEKSRAQLINRIIQNDTEGYSTVEAPQAEGSQFSLPLHLYPDEVLDDLTISPYASYTSLSEKPPNMLSGWLDKLSPQGNYVFQRRYVRFDGKNLMYFNSEKDPYPKGVIPLSVIEMARSTKENKFQVVTSHRIFVFRAENEAQRNKWCSTMQKKVAEQRQVSPRPRHTSNSHWQKSGCLEFKGHKSKVFAVLSLAEMWLYKSEQFFKMGIGICLIELRGATIREAKHRSFELITPFKIFSFTAESEREKREWMEALQDAIAETLYDYEVAEKIWSNKANKFCADCRAMSPDWASINLCVVICKQCAGQHRGLGSNISKVQSLKLDTSVWSNEIVQLFIVLGNERANQFWSPHIPPSEALYPDASAEQRREFITCKYRDGRYRLQHPSYSTQEELLQALCAAVAGPNLLKTVLQFFSTAEAEAAFDVGGCEVSQGVELWQMSESSCHGNNSVCSAGSHSSVEPSLDSIYNEITQPVMHSGYLYKAAALPRSGVSKKSRDELYRVWCSLEKSLLFYETDKCTEPLGKIEMSDVVSVGVSKMEGPTSPGPTERFRFTLDLFLGSEKVQQLGADGPDTLQAWASAIGKWFTPVSCHCLLGYEFQKVGQLRYKSMLNPDQWLQGFFILQKAHLFICPVEEKAVEDSINLRRLQELSVVPLSETSEKKEMLILVEMGRTFYLQGVSRVDFAAWCMDIQASAGGWGNALRDQQLSRSNIPIIVDSCIAFITQYGLRHEGIYRKNGAKSRIKVLMEEFRRDARNVKLRICDNFIEDVTDVLKRFFRELEDPVFTSELHPQWKEAAEIHQKAQRLERYKELINHLPHLNRKTLAALIGHLYRVQKCADFNQMGTKNLSLLFAPSLFQTDGKGEHEVKVMEDLIDNYVCIFNIDEDQVSQMDLENSLITTWKDVQLSQAGDLIIEVYLEQKLLDCCVTLKVSPSMTAEELTNQVLEMRSVAASLDIWLTFEALENGELERPLHPKEKVLEQALQWCKLPEPSSAYLLVRKVPIGEGGCLFTGAKRESPKCGLLKCREEHPKLLGSKFQERYFVIRDRKLLLLKEKRSAKPEREWPLDSARVYMGIRKKLKPPSQWGFTLTLDKQQLYLACTGQAELWDWITSILKAQHDDLRSVILRRRSSSDLSKQKFGTMSLVPLRGDSTDTTMLSANQTLRRLHNRRTLSMFFPMKMHQDSLDEQQEKEAADAEPVYEEVGNFPTLSPLELDRGLLAELSQVPAVDRSVKPTLFSEQSQHPALRSSLPPSPGQKVSSMPFTKALSLERGLNLQSEKALYHARSSGVRPTKTASLERNLEPSQVLPALAQEQVAEENQRPVLEPLFGKAPPPEASKKISHLPSPINDKLMQELSSVILRKNEGQAPELGPVQQIT